MSELGLVLKEARVKAGLSQRQMAELCGRLRRQHLSRCERGEVLPRIRTLERMAKAVGSTAAELMRRADELKQQRMARRAVLGNAFAAGKAVDGCKPLRTLEDKAS